MTPAPEILKYTVNNMMVVTGKLHNTKFIVYLLLLCFSLTMSCRKSWKNKSHISNWDQTTLINHAGISVNLGFLNPDYKLVYFGFTRCAHVCPRALQAMSMSIQMLGAHGHQIEPVFITVDPKYDSANIIKKYISRFSGKKIHGFTGLLSEIKKPGHQLGVRFKFEKAFDSQKNSNHNSHSVLDNTHDKKRIKNQAIMSDHRTKSGISHSPFIYLLSPDNHLIKTWSAGISARGLRDAILKIIEN